MNINMNIPGLKGVVVSKIEELEMGIALHVSMPVQRHQCQSCQQWTTKVHDYRIQKIKYLKWFERMTVLFYKRRRYVCHCGKRFSEKAPCLLSGINVSQKNIPKSSGSSGNIQYNGDSSLAKDCSKRDDRGCSITKSHCDRWI